MYKNILLSTTLVLLLVGCGSTSSSDKKNETSVPSSKNILNGKDETNVPSSKISLWEYIVPNQSKNLPFDKYKVVNSAISTTEIGSYTHEYLVINNNEINGSWRNFEGKYSIRNDNGYIKFSLIAGQSFNSVSGSFRESAEVGSFVYLDGTGGASYSNTFAGETSSYSASSGECMLNKHHKSITLYPGYSYNDVIELKCEYKIMQKHGKNNVIKTLDGVQRSYEYYQKDTGWIAKVDKDCIVDIADRYEFIDDSNDSCVKTVTEYQLFK